MRNTIKVAMLAAAVAVVPFAGSAAAQAAGNTAYVSPGGSSSNSDLGCRTAGFTDINAAIASVPSGGTVVVCKGTYKTSVVISKPLNLVGRSATINAVGQPPAIPELPAGSGILVIGTHNVFIKGFAIKNAGFDAVTVGASSKVRVTGNVLTHNGDVGVNLNGSSWSRADHNISKFNGGGGFLIADDIGPNSHNTVDWNVASGNPGGCGVIIAGHSTAGVTFNLVAHNSISDNGTNPMSSGAGVVIATEVPGETVANNTVWDNTIWGNGLAGVTIHAHATGQNLNGNKILDNNIGTNNVVGDQIQLSPPVTNVPDLKTTGILVGASSPVKVLISGNHIHNNHYGVFIEGLVTATFSANTFTAVPIPVVFK